MLTQPKNLFDLTIKTCQLAFLHTKIMNQSRLPGLLFLLLASFSAAFAPGFRSSPAASALTLTTTTANHVRLGMSQELPLSDDNSKNKIEETPAMMMIGETERLLLDAKKRRTLGLKQEYGATIKKDGLDGVRAVVWQLFGLSNVIFGVLGVALSLGLMLNVVGYGYYFDAPSPSFLVVDSLQNIALDKQLSMEAAKLAQQAMQ